MRGFFFGAGSQYVQHNGTSIAAGVQMAGGGLATIADATWTHVVTTYADDGAGDTDITVYVDGVPYGPTKRSALDAAGNPAVAADNSGEHISIGVLGIDFSAPWYSAPCQGFDGGIDEVAYYDYALSAEQVSAHFNATDAIPEPSSLALLSLSGLAGFLGVRRRRR